jgi:GTP-binding protein EngB required for normal cell division
VVVFGESGVGKSSVINMLLGATEISCGPRGHTFEPTSFLLNFPRDFLPNTPVTLWDTVGFNVDNTGIVPETEAIVALYKLLHELSNAGGVSLLVFVIRGPHIKESTQHNWTLFNDVICNKGIPSIVVVTGMEGMASKPNGMDDWREENKETFTKYGISPTRYACVTTSKGRKTNKGIFADEGLYLESQQRLLSIIHSAHAVLPLQVPPIQWFKTVLEKSFLGIKYRHTREKDVLVDNILETLRDKCGMAEDEAIMLEKRLKEVEIDPGF